MNALEGSDRMPKDKGRDFLFSDDCGFINGDDGDSYRYSDWSGYYHGADGSDGYKYSDGSGYFNGADGSSSRYDSSDDYDDYDDDDYSSYDSDDSSSDLAASLADLALGFGAVAVAKHTAEAREQARIEEAE